MPEVDPDALRSTSNSVSEVAGTLRDVDVAGPFVNVQGALVGSQTSQGTLWLSTRLAAAVLVYADNIGGMGHATAGAARDYSGVDHGVSTGFGRVPQ